MVKVVYVEFNGARHAVDVPEGRSLMEGAVLTMTPGIIGECGGCMACGTCHIYIDHPWDKRVSEKSALEDGLIGTVLYARENSRLACQIEVTERLEGLVVQIPECQY